jgi:hypothetical protein
MRTVFKNLHQLLDQASEMTPRETREQPMRQYRPIDHERHNRIMPPARP